MEQNISLSDIPEVTGADVANAFKRLYARIQEKLDEGFTKEQITKIMNPDGVPELKVCECCGKTSIV